MQNVRDYTINSMDTAGIYVYYVEAPTKTSQCLFATGTGFPIPYLRIRTSIPAHYVREDSIIEQIYRSSMTSIVLGEATWMATYNKSYFKRNYTGVTMNHISIKPLINNNLEREIKNNDWDLMIGKFSE